MSRYRAALAVVLAAGCTASIPAAAQAYGVSLSVSADAAEERAVTVTATGVADASTELFVTRRAAGSQACGATRATDIGGADFSRVSVTGQFAKPFTFEAPDPGQVMVCAWLSDGYSAPTARARAEPLVIAVRGNSATLSLVGPQTQVRAGETAIITPTGQTEVSRQLTISALHAGAAGDTSACGASAKTAIGTQWSLLSGDDISGASSRAISWSTPATPEAGGVWLLCGWIQESYSDVFAEAQTATFLTLAPTVGCERARRRLARATSTLAAATKQAKRAAKRARKPARRSVKAKRRAARVRADKAVAAAKVEVKRKTRREAAACD